MKTIYFDAGYVGKGYEYNVEQFFGFSCAVVCANCGQMMSVSWKNNVDEDSIPEKVRHKIKVCPVCGRKTPLKKDLSIVSKSLSRVETAKMLADVIERNAKLSSRKTVESWISKISTDADMTSDNLPAQLVNKNLSLLKQYILNMLSVESAVIF